jgi:hypothetical protein
MPHTTHAYGFEAKVSGFAGGLSARFTAGESLRPFLLELDAGGSVRSLSFEDGSREWRARASAAGHAGAAHLLYDPLEDGMEYVRLSWEGVERHVMERLIGQRFEGVDFLPIPAFAGRARALNPEERFPRSWGVMFYSSGGLTSACTRPTTRVLSCTLDWAGGRVMRGVGLLRLLFAGHIDVS